MVPDRELDDTKISFYLSQPCPAQFPQESTLLPLVRHISILSFLKTTVHGSSALVPFSRQEGCHSTRDWNTSVRPRGCSWSSRLKKGDWCVSNGLRHICWDNRRLNWGRDVGHKEASDS